MNWISIYVLVVAYSLILQVICMGENQFSLHLFMVFGEYLLLLLDVWHLCYLP